MVDGTRLQQGHGSGHVGRSTAAPGHRAGRGTLCSQQRTRVSRGGDGTERKHGKLGQSIREGPPGRLMLTVGCGTMWHPCRAARCPVWLGLSCRSQSQVTQPEQDGWPPSGYPGFYAEEVAFVTGAHKPWSEACYTSEDKAAVHMPSSLPAAALHQP